jgi:aconitate hydratase
MGQNVTQKLIATHLVDGRMEAGHEIGLRIDQTLTQDATGTMVMLELEAMGLGLRRRQRGLPPRPPLLVRRRQGSLYP